MAYTSHILDQVKTAGFQQATATSISLGIDDLLTIPSKGCLILEKHHHYGNVHAVEKLRQSIEIWYATSEYLRQEMNPNFRMTDPFNPVHIMSFSGARGNASRVHQLVGMRGLMSDPQGQMIDLPIQSNLREGLSLTNTSFLATEPFNTLLYVERIVAPPGVFRESEEWDDAERIFSQTLIGRVLADDIYMGPRYIATRNQDIGIGLVNRFITFRAQPISIRTPFTCRSTSWICRLCYGRSPTHGDLVELGEAVGIIAGQSIGEPEHVRAPSNGKIKFNEDLVHPTRTRHGHPAFLCSIDLYVTIESEDILHNVNIPPKSLLLVQNDQYVESNKESLKTYLFDSDGEMHRSTDVYHAPEFTYGNVHLLPKTSHLWILLGGPCGSGLVYLSIHKDRDQMNAHSLYASEDILLTSRSDFYGKKEDRIPDYSDLNRIICTGRRRNKFIIPLHSIQELENELMPCSGISIEIPINGIFRRNKTHSVIKKEDLIEYRGVKEFRSKYQMKVDRFFSFPKSIVGVDTQITLNLRSRVGGLVRVERKKKRIELKIFYGDIHFPVETDKISGHTGESKKVKNWIYVQRITPSKKRFFVLVRPIVTYEIMDGINLATLFPPDPLRERDNVQLRIVNYILYGNGKPIRGISTQDKWFDSTFPKNQLSEIPISYIGKRNDPSGSGLLYDNGSDCTNINPFSSIYSYSKAKIQQSLNQPQGTIHTLLNRNKESRSLIILSAANYSRMGPFKDVKYHGTCLTIENFYSSYHLITHNQILVTNYLQLDNLKRTFQVIKFKYYLMDENGKFFNPDPCRNIILNPFNLNWSFLHHNYCEETSKIITKNGPPLKSGQVILVQVDSIVIRSAKPYLATPGATVHGHYGETLYKGDTLVTFIYEKSRSGDITRGLPKVERVLEVRSIDSISMNLEKRVEGWNKCITRILGIPWGFLIGAKIIVRQITSKVLVSEDGMSNVFSPGELIGLLRANEWGAASLNTQSFISKRVFKKLARVLAKAALRGCIDWLKGLKENVVLGGLIPVGTGFKGLVHPSKQHNNIPLETKKESIRGGDERYFVPPRKLFDSCLSKKFHDIPKQSFIGFNDS
ncbi:unnamed protein product [Withania somnifera]